MTPTSRNAAGRVSIATAGMHAGAELEEDRVKTSGADRGRAHNQELHELGHIRRHGGFQWGLPL